MKSKLKIHSVGLSAAALLMSSCSSCSNVETDSEAPATRTRGGPDRIPAAAVYQVSFETGHTFSDAYDRVLLTGGTAATLDGIEILGGDGYFRLAGVKVAGAKRRVGSIQVDEQFPPRRPALGRLRDGYGARLTARPIGTLLVIGMTVAGEGVGYRSGIRIKYTVDGEQFFQDHPSAVVNCPDSADQSSCDQMYEFAFDEASALVE